jgi:hyperosmotically inducible protein
MKKTCSLLFSLFVICAPVMAQVDTTDSAQTSEQSTEPSLGQKILDTFGGAITNATTTAVITGKYVIDPLLKPAQLDISTEDGVVTLKGNVDSNTQYDRAVALAAETNDVKRVDASQLTITPSNSPISDTFTTFKIKLLLIKNSLFGGEDFSAWDIHVETNNGKVFLVGTVKTDEAKTQVLSAVSSVSGVQEVIADVRVA